ncbi:amino acid adenylation domain-containing protein [Algibacter sp. 2305UL17-15]|uniref:amino acid adenylation domain-containing protein n=1 Tax=Algibacter sp. 2305UL17-15 TaxID=3231268 RepID=UPI003459D3F6
MEDEKKISLLDKWKSKTKENATLNTIEKAPEGINIPLSSGQKRLWFLQQMYPKNPFYNYSETYTFEGELHIDCLVESLKKVYQDHDILRSTYLFENNEVVQKIDQDAEMAITIHDFSTLNPEDAAVESLKVQKNEATKHFELTKSPLVRAAIIKIAGNHHILQITLHHIVTDKWSMRIFREHVAGYYLELTSNSKLTNRKTTLQYSDYSYWIENKATNHKALAYWKAKLSGQIPQLTLPFDYNRPLKPTFKGAASFTQEYSKEVSYKLLGLSKETGTTPYNLMLAIFYLFLYRLSGQTNILIGTPITNRDRKSLENLIGFFNDTVVLRADIDPKKSFKDFVQYIKNNTLEAFENKDIPFDTLVKEMNVKRSLSTNPFFQVMFLYHSKPENPYFGDHLKLSHTWFDSEVSKFDLTIYVGEDQGILSSTFEYASDLFDVSTINRFQEHFKNLIEEIVSNPNKNIAEIQMLTVAEMKLHLQETKYANDFQAGNGIHHIIQDIAKKYPEKKAVTFNDSSLSYEELEGKSNVIAQKILALKVDRNAVIGLCVERSTDMIAGILGILKAGCCYLPIDPEYPKERINFMVSDSNAKIIVSKSHLNSCFSAEKLSCINLDKMLFTEKNQVNLPEVDHNDLAYIIYTSGSTGKPKGVPISHKNIINSTLGRIAYYKNNPEAFLLMSSISFDSSKAGIFWTLCTGGTLVISEKRMEQDIAKIGNIIKDNTITHTLMLPSLYKTILEYIDKTQLKTLSTVIVAGEACSISLCENHLEKLPEVNLHNEYGPTEASVWCSAHKITFEDLKRNQVPIGKPVANSQIYILDSNKNRVPIGVTGEIYIGGTGLSKGYLNRQELTRSLFIENPYNPNEKLYKTGDLAKYNNDGTIQFIGRVDQQIKIRGYRVELEAIENTINKTPNVEQAIVLVKENEGKPKRLIAYIKPNGNFDEQDLKDTLKKKLPDYMMPHTYVVIDNFYLLPNGKVDKKALENIALEVTTSNTKAIAAPKNEIEEQLLKIWEETLNISPIGTHDNFFEIGGDSILSIQIIAKARKNGIMLSPNQLFEHQTISGLSKGLLEAEKQDDEWNFIAKLRDGGSKKPLFCIHSGGAHVLFYGLLNKYLKQDRPIYAVQPVGLYGSEEMHQSIEEMTSAYLKGIREIQPQGPYNILVYCFSTSVGNEMAIQLDKIGEEINIIVSDTMASPWNATDGDTLKIRVFSFLKRFLSNPLKATKIFLNDRIYIIQALKGKYFGKGDEKKLEELKANLRKISVDYSWKQHNGKVSLLITDKPDKNFNEFIINSWKKYAKGGVTIYPTKGNHTTLFEEPDVKFVSEQIDKCLNN